MNRAMSISFVIWLGGVVWSVSGQFIDSEITPKIYAALFGGTLFALCCAVAAFLPSASKKPRFTAVSAVIVLCAVSQSAYALLQWAGVCPTNGSFVCGSFDNPAGLASLLAFSLPFALCLTRHPHPLIRWSAWMATFLLTVGIIVSESRSGMLALAVTGWVFCLMRWPKLRKTTAIAGTVLLALTAIALYHYKKDSADGRLLIWQCTWELIRERPWLGHGPGGFQAHYMDVQADYFRQHPDSPYVRLADDVKAPFNEYLGLWVDYGLAGLLVLAVAVILLFRAYRRHPAGSSRPAMLCLLSIAIFSLSSYPFRYPHTWILSGVSAAVLLLNAWPPPIRLHKVLTVPTALALIGVSARAFHRMQTEMRWCETADRSLCGLTEKMLPAYRELYAELKDEPLFLYNYAAELNVAGRYAESLRIGRECEARMADYFTQILLADNHRQLGNHQEAERHLLQASFMCPNRFVPLRELFRLYQSQTDTAGMHRMADAILRKPVKVDSPEVRGIIVEMERFKTRLSNQ